MNELRQDHPFSHSGVGALSDLSSPEWREIYHLLEQEQTQFLNHEPEFRSPEYPWPRDPLHDWSRAWEYPYAFHHLRTFRRLWATPRPPKVVDVGSGVTFFPFALAKLGFEVICSDVDPVCERDLGRAAKCVDQGPGRVGFRKIDGGHLPMADQEADALYCISVLEHVSQFEELVVEMARSLKPGGLFILTVDLDLRGDLDLGVEKHKALTAALDRHFQYLCPDRTIHPANVLNSSNAPFAPKLPVGWERKWFFIKQRLLKPVLGRKPRPLVPFLLSVQGFAMLRRKD